MEEIDEAVIEIESTSEMVTLRELLQRIKISKLYVNGRVTTSAEYKREAVMIY